MTISHLTLALIVSSGPAWDSEQWLGLYLKDKKVGYSSYSTAVSSDGTRTSVSSSVIDGKMLGFGLTLRITSTTETDAKGSPARMEFVTESGGKVQKVTATFDSTSIKAVSEMAGARTEKTLSLPTDGRVLDDPLQSFVQGDPPQTLYVFDPNTLELVKCQPRVLGTETLKTEIGEVEATVVEVNDPRAPLKVFLSKKGDLIKADGPFGLVMRPVSKETALAEGEQVDIALASAIVPDKLIPDYLDLSRLRLRVMGVDLSRLPSDEHQTVSKESDGWTIKVHPLKADESLFAMDGATDPTWSRPDLHIPSDDESFRVLARSLTNDQRTTLQKAEAIRQFVHAKVRANAGIGVLRGAADVLETGEGVCRDHAILMTTLLRAARIPARLASGLVYAQGAFYYHAWVEVWTGKSWLGMDSTRPGAHIDATHVKIGQGTVGSAFTSFLLDGAKITVLDP